MNANTLFQSDLTWQAGGSRQRVKTATKQVNRSELIWKHFKQRTTGHASVQLRNQIAVAYRNLVRKVAHQVADQCAVPYEDLEQIGMIGILKACERFDPTKGVDFSSFAVPYIRGEMLHHLRDHGSNVKVPRRMREANATANKITRQWTLAKGKAPTEQELAQQMQISVERLQLIRSAIANQMASSLEEERVPEAETFVQVSDRHCHLEQAWSKLRQQFNNLHPTEQELLQQVFFQRSAQKAIAQQFGLEVQPMRQKLRRVLDRIAL